MRRYDAITVASLTRSDPIGKAYRIMPLKHKATPLGVGPALSRFCDASFGMLYAAMNFETAFLEVVVRDRFQGKKQRKLPYGELYCRCVAELSLGPGNLLDLTGSACTQLGAPTDVAQSRHHGAGRAFSRSIHTDFPDIDGFLYESRLSSAVCIALFDRAIPRIAESLSVTPLSTPSASYSLLPAILRGQKIKLK